jgi:hypothetical protein
VIDCVRKVYLKEGIAGFYSGCGTNLMRTTPAAVITFTSYEFILKKLEKMFPSRDPEPSAGRGTINKAGLSSANAKASPPLQQKDRLHAPGQ